MPYVFGFLVLLNVALFGYFWANPASENDTGTLNVAKTQLQKPLNYQNSSQQLPPLIGEK